MLPAVPEAPPAVAPPPRSFSVSTDCVSGTALPSIFTRLQRRLVHVEVGLDLDARLVRPERLQEQGVQRGLQVALVARLRGLLAGARRAAGRAASSCGHSSAPPPSVIVTWSVLRPFTEEAVSCAMPRTAPGSSASDGPVSMTAAVAGVSSSANRESSGSTSCTWAPVTPSTCSIVRAISPSSARW